MNETDENYLVTILVLRNRMLKVQQEDIVQELQAEEAEADRAIDTLKKEGFIQLDRTAGILLTLRGRETAEVLRERRTILTKFLAVTAGVTKSQAEKEACKIEHIIGNKTYFGIKRYVERYESRKERAEES